MGSRLAFLPSLLAVVAGWSFLLQASRASDLKEARVTQVSREVKLIGPEAAARPAAISNQVAAGTAVQTGAESRAELTLGNQSLVRLGANTLLRVGKKTRAFEVDEGVMLLQVPGTAGGFNITANGVTVEISSATVVFENRAPTYKLLVLQGTARLYRPRHLGDSVLVRAGQMAFGTASAAVSDPVDFDVARFLKTCPLIAEFEPLGSDTLLAKESQNQQRAKSKKVLIDTNLMINGGGTLVSIVDPTQGEGTNRSEPASSAPPIPLQLPAQLDRQTNLTR